MDDFLFIAFVKSCCDFQVRKFFGGVWIHQFFQWAMDKNILGKPTLLTFLGMLIDTVAELVCIPADKNRKGTIPTWRHFGKKQEEGHGEATAEIMWISKFSLQKVLFRVELSLEGFIQNSQAT